MNKSNLSFYLWKAHDILCLSYIAICALLWYSVFKYLFYALSRTIDDFLYFCPVWSTSRLKLPATERNRTILRKYYYHIIGRCVRWDNPIVFNLFRCKLGTYSCRNFLPRQIYSLDKASRSHKDTYCTLYTIYY